MIQLTLISITVSRFSVSLEPGRCSSGPVAVGYCYQFRAA